MELKGWRIGGCTVVAESKEEAIEMYKNNVVSLLPMEEVITNAREQSLDDIFCYFELHEIDEADHQYIYDRKYPADGRQLVSLKRPYAKKYRRMVGDKKEILSWYY